LVVVRVVNVKKVVKVVMRLKKWFNGYKRQGK
jgi:hypothetical protein